MDTIRVKQEIPDHHQFPTTNNSDIPVIDLDSSDDDDSSTSRSRSGKRSRVLNEFGGEEDGNGGDKRKKSGVGVVLPDGFLDPLPGKESPPTMTQGCKQFWKAGDFELPEWE